MHAENKVLQYNMSMYIVVVVTPLLRCVRFIPVPVRVLVAILPRVWFESSLELGGRPLVHKEHRARVCA